MTTATVRIAEYGSVNDEPRALRTVLRSASVEKYHLGPMVEYTLSRFSEGWACAGSVLRWDAARIGVEYESDGAIQGASFPDTPEGLERANAKFDALIAMSADRCAQGREDAKARGASFGYDAREAVRAYVDSIRAKAKRAYAEAYFLYLCGVGLYPREPFATRDREAARDAKCAMDAMIGKA